MNYIMIIHYHQKNLKLIMICCHDYRIKIGNVNKLVLNLGNKSRYDLHYKILQLHASLEMKLVSVHRILKFQEKK